MPFCNMWYVLSRKEPAMEEDFMSPKEIENWEKQREERLRANALCIIGLIVLGGIFIARYFHLI